MKFKDLEFNNQMHGGIGATAKFNDISVSIQASSNHYCSPREDWITSKFIEDADDVSGWTSKETIEQLLEDLSNQY